MSDNKEGDMNIDLSNKEYKELSKESNNLDNNSFIVWIIIWE